jgi:RHS repeat-associated protein
VSSKEWETLCDQTCTYGYDALARVSSVGCGTPWAQTFTYDAFGNLTKSGSLNWQPGYNAANNRYTLGGTSYDAAGNLTNDTFHTYAWDAEGKPKTIDAITLIFDALGREVEMQNGGTNTEFVPRLAIMNGQTSLKVFVPLPGGAHARYAGSSISVYNVPDWLGSVRIGSTPSRTFSYSLAFAPFGEQYANSPGATGAERFATNRSDTVTDEYDADNRKLHSSQGRWISPDMGGAPSLTDPQTWNRYAYVRNSPLTGVDPSGNATVIRPDGTVEEVETSITYCGECEFLAPESYQLTGGGASGSWDMSGVNEETPFTGPGTGGFIGTGIDSPAGPGLIGSLLSGLQSEPAITGTWGNFRINQNALIDRGLAVAGEGGRMGATGAGGEAGQLSLFSPGTKLSWPVGGASYRFWDELRDKALTVPKYETVINYDTPFGDWMTMKTKGGRFGTTDVAAGSEFAAYGKVRSVYAPVPGQLLRGTGTTYSLQQLLPPRVPAVPVQLELPFGP